MRTPHPVVDGSGGFLHYGVLNLVDISLKVFVSLVKDLEVPDREPGLRCLEWVQEELQALPTIVEGFMSYASLVTCEGAMNALSREGCRHFEVFDQADEDFKRDIYKVEDPVVKESAGAIYERMWGPHGREVVRERAETARAQVTFGVCLVFARCWLCVGSLNLCVVS